MLHSAEQKGLPADFIGMEEAHASWLDTAPVTFQTDPQVKNKKNKHYIHTGEVSPPHRQKHLDRLKEQRCWFKYVQN